VSGASNRARCGVALGTPPAGAPGDLLGPLALALEARVARRTARPARDCPEARLELVFAAEALEPDERARLLDAAAERVLPVRPGALTRAVFAARTLSELARELAGARPLLAAWEAYRAARPAPRVLGILNVTPDSFSDGGRWLAPPLAIAQGQALCAEGADLLDVGGESTRPGAEPVAAEVELARVLPVVTALAPHTTLSIDTTKARVAEAALAAGARIVNDVSGACREPEILARVAAHGAGVILMHARGTPRDMQHAPHYDDVVREVAAHLRARAAAAWQAGIEPSGIALDPGLGFGKDLAHNLALLRALPELTSLGFPLVVGLSRKRFLGALTGEERPERRDHATAAGVALAHARGAALHRVHDVRAARAALALARALEEQD